MLKIIFNITLALILLVVGFLFAYFVIKTTILFLTTFNWKRRKNHSFKTHLKHFLWHFKDTRYIKLIEFVKWVIIDILRGKDQLRLYGIWAFTGYYGEGKTMGCVQFANQLKNNYPHRNIRIYSNIYVKGQVKKLDHWEELLSLPPNSIFIYDESQADFSCNNRDFPEDLLRKITQCRKRKLAMFMTSPRFNRMNINIRESVNFVIECKNIFSLDRWFKYTFYRAEDYERYYENKLKLMTSKYLTLGFVVQDRDYKMYDTVEEVGSLKEEKIEIKKKNVVQIEDYLKRFRNSILKEIELKLKKVDI